MQCDHAPENLPSHQVDHNTRDGYTAEVSEYLRENVWNRLTAKKKLHGVDVERLKKDLAEASDEFRRRLLTRGGRKGGTKLCWEKRFEEDFKNKWYHPFSMGKSPSHRSPGVSFQILNNIFKKIKLPF